MSEESESKIGVLVVDDDIASLRSFLGRNSISSGIKFYVSSTCEKALQMVRSKDSLEVCLVDKGLAKKEGGYLEQQTHGLTGGVSFHSSGFTRKTAYEDNITFRRR